MDSTKDLWTFVIALAAVVNGMGIVRLIGGFGEYLRKRHTLNITGYWVHPAAAAFQFLCHVLLWWSILGLRGAVTIDFVLYLYLLAGPTLLYLATSMLIPDIDAEVIDLRSQYFAARKTYYSILAAFWAWGLFLWPVFGFSFAPTAPLIAAWLTIALILRFTSSAIVHATLVTGNLLVYASFVALFAMQLGEVGRRMSG